MLTNPVVYWAFALAAFACEVGLLAGVCTLAWRLARPTGLGMGILAAVLTLAVFVALWAVFMAPKAGQRLTMWPRATIAGLACVVAGSGLVSIGLRTPGIALIVAGPVLFAGQAVMEFGDTG